MGARLLVGFLLFSLCAYWPDAGPRAATEKREIITESDPQPIRVSPSRPHSHDAICLTADEYAALKDLLARKDRVIPATAYDVAATFAAVQIPKVLLGMTVFMAFLFSVRRMFRPLWDWDVEENPVPSAIVLGSLIVGGSVIVYALVSA